MPSLPDSILSSSDRAEWESMSSEHRKMEFLTVRALFNELSESLGRTERASDLTKDTLGKPILSAEGAQGFSFTHCGDRVVVALSTDTCSVGADLESLNRKVHSGLKNRILSRKEQKKFNNLPMPLLWAMKEAAVKCTGTGLRVNLDTLELDIDDDQRFYVRFNGSGKVLNGYFAIWDEHALTVVTGEHE